MTAAQPACSRLPRQHRVVVGVRQHVKPSSTSVSAASSSSTGSGSSVRSSAMTSSLTQSVPSASRASRAVSTASPAVKQPGGVRQHPDAAAPRSTASTEPARRGSTRRIATVVSSVPDATQRLLQHLAGSARRPFP